MFESLTGRRREHRLAQPMLSFAVHAGLIALAIGGVREVKRPQPAPGGIVVPPFVIHDPDGYGTGDHVATGDGTVVPRPASMPGLPLPGPLPLDRIPGPGGPPRPGIPTGDFGHLLRDSAPTGMAGIYSEGDLTDSPVLVHFPEPVYPPALRAAGMGGHVRLAYVVDTDGRVEPGSIVIVSSDHPLMAEAVRVSLLAARFRPGKVRGIAVRTLVRQTITFSLMSL